MQPEDAIFLTSDERNLLKTSKAFIVSADAKLSLCSDCVYGDISHGGAGGGGGE
jgi:hypothetical protein